MPQVSERKDGLNDFLPHVGLLVSGGNTVLFIIDLNLEIRILAETVDDAAGEALDKGAKLLGIPYPGGAKMEEMALLGNSAIFDFPKAFPKKRRDLRFSFSGLKTSLLYRIQGMTEREIEDSRNDLCACYQSAVVEQLVRKTSQVCADHDFRSFGLSGGVANNDLLRKKIEDFCLNQKTLLPAAKKHTGDNAAMIAFAATFHPERPYS